MDIYNLTFVLKDATLDVVPFDFTSEDLLNFEFHIKSKFNVPSDANSLQGVDNYISAAIVEFVPKIEINEKLIELFKNINSSENITEILIYKNSFLYYDMKNVTNVYSESLLHSPTASIKLTMIEGV